MPASYTIALAGNPNCGKTALFNALTGSRQKVGNWPGVTVDKKCGQCKCEQAQLDVVDLPGIYSLTVLDVDSIDARIACDYLLNNPVDVIVNVVDGSNLERNLYLTLQLLEMGKPVVLAVNMMDVVKKRGLYLDLPSMEKQLGCPVVAITANRGQGIETLKKTITATASKQITPLKLDLPGSLKSHHKKLSDLLHDHTLAPWLALRLLEDDAFAREQLSIKEQEAWHQLTLQSEVEDADIIIADCRYQFAHQLVDLCVRHEKTKRQTATEIIDKVVLNRFFGVPVFLFVMYLMFLFAINVGGAFQDFFDIGSTVLLVNGLAHLLISWHVPVWLTAILANGIGKGINTTITFIPVIGGMFLFLSFLEDSGYMARAAFVMDRLMQKLGLPGKSFVPMIVGFGCNVPAVMGSRTLSNLRDRILSVMMMPFMSCGARLAIFAVFASAFFRHGGQNIIFLLYLTGILAAVFTGLILRKTLLTGKPAPLVMELPEYHLPQAKALGRHTWQRLRHFLKRASKVIIPVCLIIGALNAVTVSGQLSQRDYSQQSLLSAVGRDITPILSPMGVKQDNWPATVGLVTGVLAKEVVVGTLNTLYSQAAHLTQQASQDFNLWAGLKAAVLSIPQNLEQLPSAIFNPVLANEAPHDMQHSVFGVMYQRFGGPAAAFAYLLFVLLYFPCISTLAVMKREVGNAWGYFSMLWSGILAYGLAVLAYQWLTAPAHWLQTGVWTAIVLMVFTVIILTMKYLAIRQSSAVKEMTDAR